MKKNKCKNQKKKKKINEEKKRGLQGVFREKAQKFDFFEKMLQEIVQLLRQKIGF